MRDAHIFEDIGMPYRWFMVMRTTRIDARAPCHGDGLAVLDDVVELQASPREIAPCSF